jgi:hypothetical protein
MPKINNFKNLCISQRLHNFSLFLKQFKHCINSFKFFNSPFFLMVVFTNNQNTTGIYNLVSVKAFYLLCFESLILLNK